MRVDLLDLNYPSASRASWREPDEACHAAARRLAAVREEAGGVRVGAESAAVDRSHPGRGERVAREAIEIGLPTAAGVRQESLARGRVARDERVANLGSDLVRRLPDRGAEPRNEVVGIDAESRDGRGQHAIQEAAPTRMSDADTPAATIAEQDRQAVGCHHDAHDPCAARDRAVSLRALLALEIEHADPMHLLEPTRLGRKREPRA